MATNGRFRWSFVGLVAFSAVLMVVFLATGGTDLAGGTTKPAKPAKPAKTEESGASKVVVCHKSKVTIRVSVNAWPAHQAHGDVQGACAQSMIDAAKAKKAKKDKAENDEAKAEKAKAKAEKSKGEKADTDDED
jgi:hypothetical protein